MPDIKKYSVSFIALCLTLGLAACERSPYKEKKITIVVRGASSMSSVVQKSKKPARVARKAKPKKMVIQAPTPEPVGQEVLILRRFKRTKRVLMKLKLTPAKASEMKDRMSAIPRLLEDERYGLADETLMWIEEELEEIRSSTPQTPTPEIPSAVGKSPKTEVIVVGTPVEEPTKPEVVVTPKVVETVVPRSVSSPVPPPAKPTP